MAWSSGSLKSRAGHKPSPCSLPLLCFSLSSAFPSPLSPALCPVCPCGPTWPPRRAHIYVMLWKPPSTPEPANLSPAPLRPVSGAGSETQVRSRWPRWARTAERTQPCEWGADFREEGCGWWICQNYGVNSRTPLLTWCPSSYRLWEEQHILIQSQTKDPGLPRAGIQPTTH